mgnify:FL=1
MQNRNKLLDLFIGNISNAVLHKILENAIDNNEIANKYEKELTTSFSIAMKYREKINPVLELLPLGDQEYVKIKVTNRVQAELHLRIAKGYTNIDLSSLDDTVATYLKDARVL